MSGGGNVTRCLGFFSVFLFFCVCVQGFCHTVTLVFLAPGSSCDEEVSVCRRVKGKLLGGVSLNLNSLRVSDVEVLWGSLLGVGAIALLRGDVVQHDGGKPMTCRVVGPRHAALHVSLCELAD